MLFGKKKEVDPKPTWQEFAGPDQKQQVDPLLSDTGTDERKEWLDAVAAWEYIRDQRQNQQDIFTKMAQKVGPTPSPFVTSMGTREVPPNMMASLFPSKFYAAGAGPVDILAPEIESYEEWKRKQSNRFRTV